MTLASEIVEFVRERAGSACEYCGVSERDCGGALTVDHFMPSASGGTDDLANLLYCCFRCNLYKADYWPSGASEAQLWNPREGSTAQPWVVKSDGQLLGITASGTFTIQRLRLNRTPLVAHRSAALEQLRQQQLLELYRDLVVSLERLQQQQLSLLAEHKTLLDAQRQLLRRLLGREP